MGSKKKTNPEKSKVQAMRTAANKAKKRAKHLEKHPNDAQNKEILNKLMNGK